MKTFPAFIALLLPFGASADQITATLVSQTYNTSAQVGVPGGACYTSGTQSASCTAGGVTAGGSVNNPAAGPYGGYFGWVSAYGAGGPDFYGRLGTASFSGTVQITGGTGTGYLEILPSSVLATQITGGAFNVNGQPVLHSSAGYFPWTQVQFTFGDSVSYNLSVWSTDYLTTMSLSDVRVYEQAPTGCGYSIDSCVGAATWT